MKNQHPYLEYLGIKNQYKYSLIPCELCGNKDFLMIREKISFGTDAGLGDMPVQACKGCGYLMQNPRFESNFYKYYYGEYYRMVTNNVTLPSEDFIENQISRGRNLKLYLDEFINQPGTMIDVGCSVGAMMIPFRETGWSIYGVDPDHRFVDYGKNELKLPVEVADAENMQLEDNKYDLIIIMGSLEHVFDPNKVLKLCRKAAKKDATLVLEGRFNPLGQSTSYLNHNHHRYLREETIGLLMAKHGFEPFHTTKEQICGKDTGRHGNGYCLGKACAIPTIEEFRVRAEYEGDGKAEEVLKTLNDWDNTLNTEEHLL